MMTFDAAAREVCTSRRIRTNTPLQALVTLNDEQFVEAARNLAQQGLLAGMDSDDARIDFLTLRLISRTFNDAERAVVHQSLASLREFYAAHPADADALLAYGATDPAATMNPPELAAWTMLTNQLMNLDEVLCK